jgi:hypothetical protein
MIFELSSRSKDSVGIRSLDTDEWICRCRRAVLGSKSDVPPKILFDRDESLRSRLK